jgi:hypothetical protein
VRRAKQGGSVVETFLGLSDWHVRGMTRDPSSNAARVLSSKGAEMVKGDLEDITTLNAAQANACAIFLNTDFWCVYYPTQAALEEERKDVVAASQKAFDYETTCGKNAAICAAAVPTLKRIVISSQPSFTPDGQNTRSLHSEAKAWIIKYIECEEPALAPKMSVIFLDLYNTNRMLIRILNKESWTYKFTSPIRASTHLPLIDPQNSTGPFDRELIEHEAPGITLLAYDSYLKVSEVVENVVKGDRKEGRVCSCNYRGFAHDGYDLGASRCCRPSRRNRRV